MSNEKGANEHLDGKVCIICGVTQGCRKPCCNMGDRRCFGDPYDIGPHIFREVARV